MSNELTNWNGATLTYDLNGNLVNDSANTYTWSARSQLASISGTTAASFVYGPFGGTTTQGTGSANAFQFTGRENDGDGLEYNRARYYRLAFGQFISQDPIGMLGDGPNLYIYAGDAPTFWVDPTGMDKGNPKSGVCNDFDLKLRSLEYTVKLGPEIEAGPLDVGGSIFKDITTGETGGEIEANFGGVAGIGVTRVNPPGVPINADASSPEVHTNLLGTDHNFTTGETGETSMSKSLGGSREGIQVGVGIQVSLNPYTFKRLSRGCKVFVH